MHLGALLLTWISEHGYARHSKAMQCAHVPSCNPIHTTTQLITNYREREREIVCECVPFWKVVFIFCVLDFMCAGSHVNLDFEFDFQIAGSSSSSNNWSGRKGRRFQPMLFVSHICVPMCAWINLPNSIPFNIIICVSIYIFMHLECLRWHLMTTGNNIDLIG